jgi:predicted amidohydrolase
MTLSLAGLADAALPNFAGTEQAPSRRLRIALLHLAPVPGDLAHNRSLIEKAIATAAGMGAAWIITPELCLTGYTFADRIGTDWIKPQPDEWMTQVCRSTARLGVTLFLSHPERDPHSRKLHNTVFVILADGTIAGKHRKIHTLKVGSEAWSTPGERASVVPVPPFKQIGMLICADAASKDMARSLKEQGAELLVSSAAWAPGLHGPSGEWERCTSDTGLPLIVCNRTGPDRTLDFTKAESVVVQDGQRLLSLSSEQSAIFVIDWDLDARTLATKEHRTVYL